MERVNAIDVNNRNAVVFEILEGSGTLHNLANDLRYIDNSGDNETYQSFLAHAMNDLAEMKAVIEAAQAAYVEANY